MNEFQLLFGLVAFVFGMLWYLGLGLCTVVVFFALSIMRLRSGKRKQSAAFVALGFWPLASCFYTDWEFGDYRGGVVDKQGRLSLWRAGLMPISKLHDGRIAAEQNLGTYGVASVDGSDFKPLPGYELNRDSYFSDGMMLVRDQKTYAYRYLDSAYKVSIPTIFAGAVPFHEGLAAVAPTMQLSGPGNWGFIDVHGHFVIKPAYATATSFGAGRAVVTQVTTGSKLIIDRSGAIVSTGHFDNLSEYSPDGVAVFSRWRSQNDAGLVDRQGHIIINGVQFVTFADGLGAVDDTSGFFSETTRVSFRDLHGKQQIPGSWTDDPNFDGGEEDSRFEHPVFSEGLCPVQISSYAYWGDKHGKPRHGRTVVYGYIDKQGRSLPIDIGDRILLEAGSFSEGHAAVITAMPRFVVSLYGFRLAELPAWLSRFMPHSVQGAQA